MSSLIQTLAPNMQGKDYICSDLLGRFHLLPSLMSTLAFNAQHDRLIMVGNVDDYSSRQVLDYLQQPWFYMVLGSVEADMAWSSSAVKYDADVVAALRKLPMVIELETTYGKVGVIHAGVAEHKDWHALIEDIAQYDSSEYLVTTPYLREVKQRMSGMGIILSQPIENITHVISGHTPIDFCFRDSWFKPSNLLIGNRAFIHPGDPSDVIRPNSVTLNVVDVASQLIIGFVQNAETGLLAHKKFKKTSLVYTFEDCIMG